MGRICYLNRVDVFNCVFAAIISIVVSSSSFSATPAKVPEVSVAEKSTLDLVSKNGLEILAPGRSANIRGAYGAVSDIARRLSTTADSLPLQIAIVDDATIGVSMTKPEAGGARVLLVNSGTLSFVENDDELAHFIGTALEQETSEIAAVAKRRASSDDEIKSFLGRGSHTESEVKSVTGRLIRSGYNPHAAYEVQNRLIEKFGDSVSLVETSTASRRDAIGLAIAYWTRELGRQSTDRLGTAAKTQLITDKFRFLRSPEFIYEQKHEAEKMILGPLNTAVESYTEVVNGTFDGNSDKLFDRYRSDFKKNWDRINRRYAATLNPFDRQTLQLRLHERLQKVWAEAQKKFAPSGFQAKSAEQVEQLGKLEYRPMVGEITNGIGTLRDQLNKSRTELRRAEGILKGETDADVRSILSQKIASLRAEYIENQRTYELAKRQFVADPDFDSRVDTLLATRDQIPGSIESASEFQKLGFRYRIGADEIDATADRRKLILRQNSDLILKAVANSEMGSMQFGNLLGEYFESHPDASKWGPGIKVYLDRLSVVLQSGVEFEERAAAFGRMNNLYYKGRHQAISVFQYWEQFWRANPKEASALFDRYVRILSRNVMELSDVYYFLESTRKHREPKFGSNVSDLIHNAEHIAGEERIPAIFRDHPKIKSMLAEKTEGFLSEALQGAARGEGRSYMLDFFNAVKWQLGGMSTNSPNIPPETIDNIVRSFGKSLVVETGGVLSQQQAEAATLFRYRWLFDLSNRPEMVAKHRAALVSLSRSQNLNVLGNEWFDFRGIAKSLHPDAKPSNETFELLYRLKDSAIFRSPNYDDATEAASVNYFKWVAENHPEDAAHLFKIYGGARKEEMSDIISKKFGDRLRSLIVKNGGVAKAVTEFLQEIDASGISVKIGENGFGEPYRNAIRSLFPSDDSGKVRFYLEYVEGVSKHLELHNAKSTLPTWSQPTYSAWLDSLVIWELEGDRKRLSKVDPELVGKLFLKSVEVERASRNSVKLDRVFDVFWDITENRPDLRSMLAAPENVGMLSFEQNQIRLARFQLESKVPSLKPGAQKPRLTPISLRPDVFEISELIERQFPKPSATRNAVIDAVEKQMTSTRAESIQFGKIRLGEANWAEHGVTSGLDAPSILVKNLESEEDRLKAIRYLVEKDAAVPRFSRFINIRYGKAGLKDNLEQRDLSMAKRRFVESPTEVRTFLLQSILDENSGLLSNRQSEEKLMRLVLGETANNKYVRVLFNAYLDSVPTSEKKVILANLLSNMVGRPKAQASLKDILESMGPFGIKAGQFLRTSGVLPKAERAQLENFLNRAAAPNRAAIYDRLEKIFGARLVGFEPVEHIGDLVGSGSLNYVVRAQLRNPRTGKSEDVVIRMLRESAEGQIQNENAVWESVGSKLRTSSDPEILRMGNLIEETRLHSWRTLKPGGVEFDLAKERAMAKPAESIYARMEPDPDSGFRQSVTEPLSDFQSLIDSNPDPTVSKTASVYRFVESVDLADVEPKLRAKLAAQILKTELGAIFSGSFDADGHPGNWLVDLKNKVLVRTDYAQIRLNDSPVEKKAFAETMKALIRPEADEKMIRSLVENLGTVFSIDGGVPSDFEQQIRAAVKRDNMPEFTKPHERLVYVQEQLEKHYIGNGRKGFSMSLRETPGAMLAALSKVQEYGDYMAPVDVQKTLLGSIGVSRVEMGALLAKQKIKESVKRVVDVVSSDCIAWFTAHGRRRALNP